MARTDQPTEVQLRKLYAEVREHIAPRYGETSQERVDKVKKIVAEQQPNRGQVSAWIDWFLRQPLDHVEPAAQTGPPVVEGEVFDPQTLEIGVYRLPDPAVEGGTLYVVKPNKEGTYKYASKIVPVTSERLTEEGQVVKVEFQYEKGAIYKLRPNMLLEFAEVEALSIQYKHCLICGHGIKVAKSVKRGVGPYCYARYFKDRERAVAS
jgi:hypothetical protein